MSPKSSTTSDKVTIFSLFCLLLKDWRHATSNRPTTGGKQRETDGRRVLYETWADKRKKKLLMKKVTRSDCGINWVEAAHPRHIAILSQHALRLLPPLRPRSS